MVERLAIDINREFDNSQGFSVQNLWYMRQFYIEYKDDPILQQLVGEIPWGHNILIFSKVKGIHVTKPQGAFYMSILFEDNILNAEQILPLDNVDVKKFVEEKVQGVETDKRFVYYLLGAAGICVVPLTGFCCERKGFRITLLETDDQKRIWTWNTIAESIKNYIASA